VPKSETSNVTDKTYVAKCIACRRPSEAVMCAACKRLLEGVDENAPHPAVRAKRRDKR
jgi:ribosomal protein L34E